MCTHLFNLLVMTLMSYIITVYIYMLEYLQTVGIRAGIPRNLGLPEENEKHPRNCILELQQVVLLQEVVITPVMP